jgi:structure-specific endonuclease subunit SLX1
MYVYLLQSNKKTYIGATVNLKRRLRQHNREITGGAKYTSKDTWVRVCYVSGFPTWKDTLQFEWKWKQLSRKIPSKNSLQRRLEALNILVSSDKSTSTSTPFNEWTLPLCIHEN